jgi:hypothetical protein
MVEVLYGPHIEDDKITHEGYFMRVKGLNNGFMMEDTNGRAAAGHTFAAGNCTVMEVFNFSGRILIFGAEEGTNIVRPK